MKEATTLLKFLETLKDDENILMYDKVNILFKIADDYDVHEILEQIVTDDDINEIVRGYLNDWSSWELIAIFLSDIRLLNQPYYYLNGYGSISNLTLRQFNIILDDFIEEIKYKGLENELVK